MRNIYLSILGFLLSFAARAQEFSTKEIALMEAAPHLARPQGETTTFASDNFDVKYYRCRWQIDPAIRYINGSITVYFTTNALSNSITLDMMNSLQADSVLQRQSRLISSQTTNTITIQFATPLAAGVLDSVSIFYQGVPANTGFGSFIQSSHAGIPVAWSLSEPYGSRDWWPCKNGLDDKADSMDIFIIHPSQYRAASNGLLQSEQPWPGNQTITHWRHRYPIASYLVCFAVTNYVVQNTSVQLGNVTLPMQTHCYPEDQAAFAANTPKVLSAMQFFHARFGDYPFIKEKYGHVQFGWGGGMEHQTASFIVSPSESLMAHELAHQWFGDKLTTHSWQEIWLNEGFATHLAAMYMEDAYPASIYTNRRAIINNITSVPDGSVKVADTTNLGLIFSSRLSYNKGSYLVYMLRFILGDATFFKAIKNYLNDPLLAYNFSRTTALKKHLEEESGKDLTRFFEQWYEGQGYPSFQVSWSMLGTNHVDINLRQTTSHPSVNFFETPVTLQFKNASREQTIVVDHRFNGQQFREQINFVPDTVLVDPEYWLISRNNSTQKVAATNSGNATVEIFPNPAKDPLQIVLRNFSSSRATIRILNAAGQRMHTYNVSLVNGAEIITLPLSNWSRGLYTLQVLAGEQKITKQFLR
ncbi:MAG: T9SS type A sorting domain-containing protein [Chitinophagaceae bacterium]|nr:MAG: T9SS type A sorting domain-containing protein [Chitinophagaceae bacterium]